jgi:putative membrane protein
MKWLSVGVLGAFAALGAGGVVAGTDADALAQVPPRLMPAPQAVVQRPGMFAPSSAASARRLTPEQREEWRFLKEAAADNRFETDASRLALSKSKDEGVRSFATSLIDHHASVANMINHMLHVRSMAAPMLANDQRKTLNRLSKLQGRRFDREYLSQVALRSQREGVANFERASLVVQDPALKSFIDRTLPTLQSQLASAERINVPGEAAPRTAIVRTQGPAHSPEHPGTHLPAHLPASRTTARNNQ